MSNAPRSLSHTALVGFLWTATAMGAQAIMQIVAIAILARLLSPAEFGVFILSMAILNFSAIFSELGVGPALVQRSEIGERHIRVGFTLSLLFCLMMAGGVWLASPWFARLMAVPELGEVISVACLVLIFQGVSAVSFSLALRALRFRWLAAIDTISFTFGFVIVGPVLAWQGYGVWALVGAYLAQYALRMALLLYGQPHARRPAFDSETAAMLLHFGAGFSLARIGNYVAGQADKLIVGRWLGAAPVGIYGHAYQLMYAPALLIGQALDRVLFPTMATVQTDTARLAKAYRTGVSVCALVILPLSLVTMAAAPEIVAFVLGPKWMATVDPLRVLAAGMLFRTSYKISDSIARATGAVYARAWRQWLFAGSIVIGALVGQSWGIIGVAAGVVVALAVNFLFMVQLSLYLTGLTWRSLTEAHYPAVRLSVLVGIPAFLVAGILRDHSTPALIVLCTLAVQSAILTAAAWRLFPRLFLGADATPLRDMIASRAATWRTGSDAVSRFRHGRAEAAAAASGTSTARVGH